MANITARLSCLLLSAVFIAGCSSYQPTKNVWKGTKDLWYTYVSPPASVDYGEKGNLSPQAESLSRTMLGIDVELGKLERVMLNADKPPTRAWMDRFFASFPWMSGFTGVKYDGTILGQEPATSMKDLDYIPLLYEDKKQNSRALRGDVQNTPLGPEVMLAAPLYDGIDFLGIVVAHFDMRSLVHYSQHPEDIVILSPQALLWPGKYDYAATPLSGVNWSEVVTKSSVGKCTNATGTFYYMIRYLGNLPLVFATPADGTFPEGDGNLEQGLAFFPKEREKLPPPPQPERKEKRDLKGIPVFKPAEDEGESGTAATVENVAPPAQNTVNAPRDPNEIQPGSQESVLMKRGQPRRETRIQERQLEGENVQVERVQRPRKRPAAVRQKDDEPLDLMPDSDAPTLSDGRPSPFGPHEDTPQVKTPSPFGPETNAGKTSEEPVPVEPDQPPSDRENPGEDTENKANSEGSSDTQAPATLPGGRPSPFGPGK